MKTMFPLGYHHNGFVATHALGHMMYVRARSSRSELTTEVFFLIITLINQEV